MKSITIALIVCFFHACSAPEDYKALRQSMVDTHDKVMLDGEILHKNHLLLDSLIDNFSIQHFKVNDTASLRKHLLTLTDEIQKAEDKMNVWMENFQPDISGKSNQEAVKYFKKEKLNILEIDSLYKKYIHESDVFLNQLKNP